MRPLTQNEESVLGAIRVGFGSRIVREELGDDPQRGLWANFHLVGEPFPTQVAVGYLARQVEAGRSIQAVVDSIVAGPPPDQLMLRAQVVPTLPLAEHHRLVLLVLIAGVAVGIAVALAVTVGVRF